MRLAIVLATAPLVVFGQEFTIQIDRSKTGPTEDFENDCITEKGVTCTFIDGGSNSFSVAPSADIVEVDFFDGWLYSTAGSYELLSVSYNFDRALNSKYVVVVPADSEFQSMRDLYRSKVCMDSQGSMNGLRAMAWASENPASSSWLKSTDSGGSLLSCETSIRRNAEEFFSTGCSPYRPGLAPGFCDTCAGDCSIEEAFNGDPATGPLRGMFSGMCDVAFVDTGVIQSSCQADNSRPWCEGQQGYRELANLGSSTGRAIMIRTDRVQDATGALKILDLMMYAKHEKIRTAFNMQTFEVFSDKSRTRLWTQQWRDLSQVPEMQRLEHCIHTIDATPDISILRCVDRTGVTACAMNGARDPQILRVGVPSHGYTIINNTDDYMEEVLNRIDSLQLWEGGIVDDLLDGRLDFISVSPLSAAVYTDLHPSLQMYAATKPTELVMAARDDLMVNTLEDLRGLNICTGSVLDIFGITGLFAHLTAGQRPQSPTYLSSKSPLGCESPLVDTIRMFFGNVVGGSDAIDGLRFCGSEETEGWCQGTSPNYARMLKSLSDDNDTACDAVFMPNATFLHHCDEYVDPLNPNEEPVYCSTAHELTRTVLDRSLIQRMASHVLVGQATASGYADFAEFVRDTRDLPDAPFFLQRRSGFQITEQGFEEASIKSNLKFSFLSSVPPLSTIVGCIDSNSDECKELRATLQTECVEDYVPPTLRVGLAGIAADNIESFEQYFRAFEASHPDERVVALFTNSYRYLNTDVDILFLDPVQAFFAWKLHGHLLLARDVGQGAVSHSVAYKRKSSVYQRFSDFRGARICSGEFLSLYGVFVPVSWAIQNFENSSFISSPISSPLTSCVSPLADALEAFFSDVCAPPAGLGEVGLCTACDPDTPCDRSNRYAGEEGALLGLSEGACDVAFVRADLKARVCEGDTQSVPQWCTDDNIVAIDNIGDGDGQGFGRTEPLFSMLSRLFTGQIDYAKDFIQGLNTHFVIGDETTPLAGIIRKDFSPTKGPYLESYEVVSKANTDIIIRDLKDVMQNLPGVIEELECRESRESTLCLESEFTDCPAFSESARLYLPYDLIDNRNAINLFFTAQARETDVMIYPIRYGGNVFVDQDVDLLSLDAASAVLAWRKHGWQVLLETKADTSGTSEQVSVAVVREDSLHVSFADLRGTRSCHGQFLDAKGTFVPMSYAWRAGHMDMEENGLAIDDCDSPMRLGMNAFFEASCAPPLKAGYVGICTACMVDEPCDETNRYAGPMGALRGLAENACDVAFTVESDVDIYRDLVNRNSDFGAQLPDLRIIIDDDNEPVVTETGSPTNVTEEPSDEGLTKEGEDGEDEPPTTVNLENDELPELEEGLGVIPGKLLMINAPQRFTEEQRYKIASIFAKFSNQRESANAFNFVLPDDFDASTVANHDFTESVLSDFEAEIYQLPGFEQYEDCKFRHQNFMLDAICNIGANNTCPFTTTITVDDREDDNDVDKENAALIVGVVLGAVGGVVLMMGVYYGVQAYRRPNSSNGRWLVNTVSRLRMKQQNAPMSRMFFDDDEADRGIPLAELEQVAYNHHEVVEADIRSQIHSENSL